MGALVVLACAAALVGLGAASAAAVSLRREVRRLAGAVRSAGADLRPLVDELADEQAVMQTELDALARTKATRAATAADPH